MRSRRGGEWSWVNGFCRQTREPTLIKVSPIREDELLGEWIEELPPFVLSRITHKDCLFHVWTESTSLVLLHMNISKRAKDTNEREVRLLLEHEFIWSDAMVGRGGKAVVKMDSCGNSVCPERPRKTSFIQQCSDNISNRANGMFSNTI